MKNLVFALAAVVALSMSASSFAGVAEVTQTTIRTFANTAEAQRILTEIGLAGEAVTAGSKSSVALGKILLQAAEAARKAAPGTTLTNDQLAASFVAKVQGGNNEAINSMHNYAKNVQVASAKKGYFTAAAADGVDARVAAEKQKAGLRTWMAKIRTVIGKGITSQEADEIENAAAVASVQSGETVYGAANMCRKGQEECFEDMGDGAVLTVAKMIQSLKGAASYTVASIQAAGAQVLKARTGLSTIQEAYANQKHVAETCPTTLGTAFAR